MCVPWKGRYGAGAKDGITYVGEKPFARVNRIVAVTFRFVRVDICECGDAEESRGRAEPDGTITTDSTQPR